MRKANTGEHNGGSQTPISLATLMDYQRFEANDGLGLKLQSVYDRYVAHGVELADDELDVSAAGTSSLPVKRR